MASKMEDMKKLFADMFKKHEETVLSIISANTKINSDNLVKISNEIKELNRKLNEIQHEVRNEIADLKQSLEFSENMCEEKIQNIEDKVRYHAERMEALEVSQNQLLTSNDSDFQLKMKDKLREIEDRSRRNNLRVDGVRETESESWDECEEKVLEVFEKRLGVNGVIVERAHRVNRRKRTTDTVGRPKTIVLKLLNYKDKVEILKRSKKQKNTGIYINEDYSEATMQIRKQLKGEMKEIREKGKYCIIKYDKLFTRDFRPRGPVTQNIN